MNRPVWCECCRVQCNNYRHYQQHIRGRRHLLQERQHAIDIMNNEIQQARDQAGERESGQSPPAIPQNGFRELTRLVNGASGNSDERDIGQSSSARFQPTQRNSDHDVIDVDDITEVRNNHALPTPNENTTSRIEHDIEPMTFEELCQKKGGILYVEKLDDKPSKGTDPNYIAHPRECPICQNDLCGEVDLLECRHVLCRTCADKMRKTTFVERWNSEQQLDIGTFSCPLCRKNVRTTYRYTSYVNYKVARENRSKTMSEKTQARIEKKRAKNQRRRDKFSK